jgi:copper(I)-binding protein
MTWNFNSWRRGLAFLAGLAACGHDPIPDTRVTSGSLTVHTSYALPPFTDAPMPVYLTVDNAGALPDTLLGLSSPASPHAMLHGGTMDPMAVLEIPAGGSLELRPGGTHLMLDPPLPRFAPGDSVEITLRFAQAGAATVWARVISYDELDRVRP